VKADGGAALPVIRTGPKYTERGTPYGEQIYSVGGMTLRDYFIAHAPDEPKWSFPVNMPSPRPLPHYVAVGQYGEKCVNGDEISEWDAEQKRQRYIQWPGAWADAMLAERERGENNG
jgi:hypothetical protein